MGYTQELTDEIKTVSQIRAAFYGYFSKIFREPVKEDFIGLTEQFLPHFERLAEFTDTDRTQKAIDGIKKYITAEKSLTNKDEYLDDLNRQFTSTYLLGRTSVPTSASVYLSPDKLLKGDAWEKVCKVYRARGFKMPESFNEPEDHIAMELLYLKKLSDLMIDLIDRSETDKTEEILKEQKTFIEEHMLTWIPYFAELTDKQSRASSLYGPAAIVMTEFLRYDSGLTDELLDALKVN